VKPAPGGITLQAVRRRRRLGVLVMVLGSLELSGCANYVWTKADITPEAFARDSSECDSQARELAQSYWVYAPPRFGVWRGHFSDPFGGPPAMDLATELDIRDHVFGRCMTLKGYRLEKAAKSA
jgi:hypothetical protein